MVWTTQPTPDFDAWFDGLGQDDQEHVIAATMYLEQEGPSARMPLSYPIKQPNTCDMKELRPASRGRSEVRILYAFDYRRQAILLLGGDKAGQWTDWYDRNVPKADKLFVRQVEQARQADPEAQVRPTPKAPKRGRKKR